MDHVPMALEVSPETQSELTALAKRCLERGRGRLVEPESLVNELYEKIGERARSEWKSRSHFIVSAVCAMRNILIEKWRRDQVRGRRGGPESFTVSVSGISGGTGTVDIVELIDVFEQLKKRHGRPGQVALFRIWGGLTTRAISQELAISVSTVESDWRFARAWLRREFSTSSRDSSRGLES